MNSPLRILLLEDRPTDAELILRELAKGGIEVLSHRVETEDNFGRGLRDFAPELILADYSLPTYDGVSALKLARQLCPDVPFIFISGTLGEEIAIEALKHGATDYVLKQRLNRLLPAARRALHEAADQRRLTQAETDLRLQSAALESAANAIFITDRDGTMLWVNPAFCELTGYSRTEILGQTPRLLKSGKHDQAFYKSLWDTILAGQVCRTEMINRRKDGSLFTETSTITPVRGPGGQITHFVAVKQDITEQRQLEEQLRQAQKLEAIGQLAGGVAHDFNNILAVIQMRADLSLTGEELPADAREALQEIRSAAVRAANLTRQLLLFSRRQVMQPQNLDLNEVVAALAKMLQRIIGEDVELQLHLDSRKLTTLADAGMLDQVLLNLAVNARDAMPDGGSLTIETGEEEVGEEARSWGADAAPGRYVRLRVSDTGVGIPAEVLPRIFEPFFTTKEAGKGTGLGLATVFGIIKQHEGWLRVESTPGRGTTFHIFLPASVASAVAQRDDGSHSLPRGGTETILLVEDEPALRALTRLTLERNGYAVLEADSGVHALQVWESHRDKIALLLTDLVLPAGITGWQLAEKLRAKAPGLKVIYTTGYSPDIAGKALDVNARSSFLQKPVDTRQLLEAVRKCLDA